MKDDVADLSSCFALAAELHAGVARLRSLCADEALRHRLDAVDALASQLADFGLEMTEVRGLLAVHGPDLPGTARQWALTRRGLAHSALRAASRHTRQALSPPAAGAKTTVRA